MSRDDLRAAVFFGDLETLRRLIQEEGVDVNSLFDVDEKTALHSAAKRNGIGEHSLALLHCLKLVQHTS